MINFIARFIFALLMSLGLILGAWLGGADPSAWTFTLAVAFSLFMAAITKPEKRGVE
jgi:hypothetical protein